MIWGLTAGEGSGRPAGTGAEHAGEREGGEAAEGARRPPGRPRRDIHPRRPERSSRGILRPHQRPRRDTADAAECVQATPVLIARVVIDRVEAGAARQLGLLVSLVRPTLLASLATTL